ncbi:uncharacterized protein LOC131659268 [Vicia villosa]|uniref:uncharacterized protein LOC131659268 n=1 Tax=Vicia villosa TaxID=3911 RepID=UPI00273C181B|nr:uncharacterized protein LOC131659268 [Vicia villosa]
MNFEFPDEDVMLVTNYEEPGPNEGPEPGSRWTMVFDGASNALGNGIGDVIISPKDGHTTFTARLCFDCTNNMAEYVACIMGITVAIDLGIKFLEVYGDSALVICHIKGEWDTKHPNLIAYKDHVVTLVPYFEEITFEHIPREENQLADALTTMSFMFKVRWDNVAPMITIERLGELVYCCEIVTEEVKEKPWFYEVKRYLEAQEYPEGASIIGKKFLRRFSAKFYLSNGILYKHNHDSTLLHCVNKKEVEQIMEDIHEEIERTLHARRIQARLGKLESEEEVVLVHSSSDTESEEEIMGQNPPAPEKLLGDYGRANSLGGRLTIECAKFSAASEHHHSTREKTFHRKGQ